MTEFENLLPLIDRVVAPITDRMERMESKLDEAIKMGARVAIVEIAKASADVRLKALEDNELATRIQLARAEGRNSIINWILGLIGAPLVVAAAGAGIVKALGLI